MRKLLLVVAVLVAGCDGRPVEPDSVEAARADAGALVVDSGEWTLRFDTDLGWEARSPSYTSTDSTMVAAYMVNCGSSFIHFFFRDARASRLVGSVTLRNPADGESYLSVLPVAWSKPYEGGTNRLVGKQFAGWLDEDVFDLRATDQWRFFVRGLVVDDQTFTINWPFEEGTKTFEYGTSPEAITETLIRCTGLDRGTDPDTLLDAAMQLR